MSIQENQNFLLQVDRFDRPVGLIQKRAFHNPMNIHLNLEEANAFKWTSIKNLKEALERRRHEFTAWFSEALDIALKFLDERSV